MPRTAADNDVIGASSNIVAFHFVLAYERAAWDSVSVCSLFIFLRWLEVLQGSALKRGSGMFEEISAAKEVSTNIRKTRDYIEEVTWTVMGDCLLGSRAFGVTWEEVEHTSEWGNH